MSFLLGRMAMNEEMISCNRLHIATGVDMFGTKRVRSAVSCGQQTQELVLTKRSI